jgi:hypothetical protein
MKLLLLLITSHWVVINIFYKIFFKKVALSILHSSQTKILFYYQVLDRSKFSLNTDYYDGFKENYVSFCLFGIPHVYDVVSTHVTSYYTLLNRYLINRQLKGN